MTRIRFLAALALILSSSVALGEEGARCTHLTYSCTDGLALHVALDTRNETATVSRAGASSVTLPQIVSADGARYAARGYEFWEKGEGALWTEPGAGVRQCHVKS